MLRALLTALCCAVLARAAQPLYTIETLAGSAWTGDGRSATSALLVQPQFVAVDPSGNIYVSDSGDHRVRRITPAGIIQTVAGTGTPGARGDGGPAVQAQLNAPYGLSLDSAGNLYIADLGNGMVRRVGVDGNIITVAGGGKEIPTGDAPVYGPRAKLIQPRDVRVDRSGNVFIADFGAHQVYKLAFDGMLTVVAGTGELGALTAPGPALKTPLAWPAALALDASGVLYVADSGNRRVRKVVSGVIGTVLDNKGSEVEVGTATGLALDPAGRLYIADGSPRVTVLTPTGEVTSVGIGGASIAADAMFQLFSTEDRQVKRLSGSKLETIAGSSGGPGAGDGSNPDQWRFSSPAAILRDLSGYVYIADTGNGRIRRLSPSGVLSTIASIQTPVSLAMDSRGRVYVGDAATSTVYRLDGSNPPQILARNDSRPMQPAALTFDPADNLFIADASNGLIRRVAPDGAMTVVAGGGSETADGIALLAKLAAPSGLAFDSDGGLVFSEAGSGRIRKLLNGAITTIPGTELLEPHGVHFDQSGNLWVADARANRIICIDAKGQWTPIAGSGDKGFAGDGGLALSAMLSGPFDVLPDSAGGALVVDTGNHRIRSLKRNTEPDPVVSSPEPTKIPQISILHSGTMAADSLAPGQLAYVQGEGLQNLGVYFGDVQAPLIANEDRRLTVQVPAGLLPGAVEVSVRAGNDVRSHVLTKIVRSSPAILTAEAGRGQALAINEDGTVNSPANPAARGGIVSLFITGEGAGTASLNAEMAVYPADILWAGPAPGLIGVFQVNLRTPGGFAPSGVVPVTLSFEESGLRLA